MVQMHLFQLEMRRHIDVRDPVVRAGLLHVSNKIDETARGIRSGVRHWLRLARQDR